MIMAELKPEPLPCPKCGKAVHVWLTGYGLKNWFYIRPECECFPKIESKHFWINEDDYIQQAEEAYREMTEAWNGRADDGNG